MARLELADGAVKKRGRKFVPEKSVLMNPEKVVRIAGVEPARLAALPPQSSVSANSTICATGQ
jgi:hypothetical protein